MIVDPPIALLDHYRAIESKARDMLDSARASRWDDVARVREDFRELIAALEAAKATQALTPAEDGERLKLLKSIVVCDGQTRRLTDASAQALDGLLALRQG